MLQNMNCFTKSLLSRFFSWIIHASMAMKDKLSCQTKCYCC